MLTVPLSFRIRQVPQTPERHELWTGIAWRSAASRMDSPAPQSMVRLLLRKTSLVSKEAATTGAGVARAARFRRRRNLGRRSLGRRQGGHGGRRAAEALLVVAGHREAPRLQQRPDHRHVAGGAADEDLALQEIRCQEPQQRLAEMAGRAVPGLARGHPRRHDGETQGMRPGAS